MKILSIYLLISLACFSSFAQKSECRAFYGNSTELSTGDKVRSMLSKMGDPRDLLSNYESNLTKISEELGIPKETVGTEIAKMFKQMIWEDRGPGLKFRKMIEVPGTEMMGFMYLLAPNFKVPAHLHGGDEITAVIEGTFESEGVVYRAGQTIRREEGTIDPPGNAGPEGSMLFVFRVRPVKAVPAPTP